MNDITKDCLNCHLTTPWNKLAKYILVDEQEFFLCQPCETSGRVCFGCGIWKPLSQYRMHFNEDIPFFSSICESCDPTGIDDYHFMESKRPINIFAMTDLELLENTYHLKQEILDKLAAKQEESLQSEEKEAQKKEKESSKKSEKSWLQSTKENAALLAATIKSNFGKNSAKQSSKQQSLKEAIGRMKTAGMGIEKQRRHEGTATKETKQSRSIGAGSLQDIQQKDAASQKQKPVTTTFIAHTRQESMTGDSTKVTKGGMQDAHINKTMFSLIGRSEAQSTQQQTTRTDPRSDSRAENQSTDQAKKSDETAHVHRVIKSSPTSGKS